MRILGLNPLGKSFIMQNKIIREDHLIWNPESVDRGGPLEIELKVEEDKLTYFNITPSKESYFSIFEVSVFTTFLDFVKKSSLLAIKLQTFREIENFLRIDNAVAISKNDEDGILLLEELKDFLILETLSFNLLKNNEISCDITQVGFIEGVKTINAFLDDEFNCDFYIKLFDQTLKLDSFFAGELTFFIDKMEEKLSQPLVEKIFFKKFLINHIKLVAGHSLTS